MPEEHPVVKNVGVDVGALAQPLTKLVEVVGQAMGAVYRPVGTVLQAYADRKANVVLAEGQERISEIQRRAAIRLAHIEVERQKNLDAIIEKAQTALPDKVSDTPVAKDWITHFFNTAQDVSDADMQNLWGRILAGEVAEPGRTSKRTLEFLKIIDKEEAEAFELMLSVCFKDANGWHFYFDDDATTEMLRNKRPGANVKRHLVDIGLLCSEGVVRDSGKCDGLGFYGGQNKYKFVAFGEKPVIKLSIPFGFPEDLPEALVGFRYLTSVGQELSRVAKDSFNADFVLVLSASFEKQFKLRIELDNGSEVA
jgi:hypothetical protein